MPDSNHARPEPRCDRPRLVVILSTERSGSTLLSVMLGAHPRLLAPPELHLLRYERFEEWRTDYPQALVSLAWLAARLQPELERTEWEREFAGATTESVYRALLERLPPEQSVIDKTPAYARSTLTLERIERLRPFYVWLVRHPLAVAHSRMELLHRLRREERTVRARLRYPAYLARRTLRARSGSEARRQIRYWLECNLNIRAHLAGIEADRQHALRYERLVREPRTTLAPLLAQLGLEWAEALLEPWRNAPDSLAWGLGDEKLLETRRVDPGRADAWRGRLDEGLLPPEARRLLEQVGDA